MRIAIDGIPLLRGRTAGIQNHARGICRSLADLGGQHEYFVVYERSFELVKDFDDSFVHSLGVGWECVPAWSPGPTDYWARRIWQGWALPRLLRRLKADVYYSATTRGPTRGGVGGFITIHDLAREAAGLAPPPPEVVQLAACSHGVFAVSDATARDVQKLLAVPPGRIVTIYNGSALGIAPADAITRRRVCHDRQLIEGRFLLCVGDENWRRRYDLLWQAMESLWSAGRVDDLRVVFVGRQDWREGQFYPLVQAKPRRERALFLNHVDQADLSALYSSALALVLPTEAEGFGMPVIEAMLCRCPVLCSDIQVLHEVAGAAARYFALTAEAIAHGIQAIAADEPLRRELVRLGLKQAPCYTWRGSAERVLQTFQRSLETKKPK